jgi:hypothetical protein
MSEPFANGGLAPETLMLSKTAGSALTGTAAASLLPTAAKFTIPAGKLQVGDQIRIRARGEISNIVTTPGTLTLTVLFNSTPITVFTSGAVALNTTAKTNVSWLLDLTLTVVSIGSGTAATLLGIGTLTSESVVGAAAGTTLTAALPASAPAAGTGFDSTVANIVDLQGVFSLTGNSMTLQMYELTLLG